MNCKIKNLSPNSFAKFGGVIEPGEEAGFEVLLQEKEPVGWRLAISRIDNKGIGKLARHPNTIEYFAPLNGIPLMCVSGTKEPSDLQVFLLDKPIYIHKNIWHATMSLSDYAVLSICENLYVESEEYVLNTPLEVVVKEVG